MIIYLLCLHIKNIYSNGELDKKINCQVFPSSSQKESGGKV